MRKIDAGKECKGYMVFIMAAVSALVACMAVTILYFIAFNEQKKRLLEIAQSQARLIEAVAEFDRKFSAGDHPEGAFGATISKLDEAREKSEGIGKTGEICLVELRESQIIFPLRNGHSKREKGLKETLPMGSDHGQPSQNALLGRSGSMTGLDYRGVKVLAAYEPVRWPGRTMGIVVKLDLFRIRWPFIKGAIITSVATFFAVISGVFLFRRINNPLMLQLEESEAKFRNIVEKLPVASVTTDDAGNMDHINSKFMEIFGWTADDIKTPRQWWTSLYPDESYRKKVQAAWQVASGKAHAEGKETEPQRWLVNCKNGDVKYVEFRTIRIWKNINVITLHDMTEIKATEEALRKSERDIRTVFENMKDTYYRTDREGRIVTLSPSARDLTGYEPQEAAGKQIADFYINPGDRAKFLADLEKAGDAIHNYETAIKRKDGSKVWVSTNARYWRDEKGLILGVEGFVRDVTEHKKAEDELKKSHEELDRRVAARTKELSEANKLLIKEVARRKQTESALRESETRLNNVLMHIKDVVWSVSAKENKLLYISPAAENIYGRKVSDFHNNSNLWLEAIHPEDRPLLEKSGKILAKQGHKEVIYRIVQPGGNVRWVEERAWLFTEKDGSPPVIHGIASDITDKKMAEKEAKLQQQQLIRADKMKSLGVLVSGVAHEINNPNNFILLNSQTLEELVLPLIENISRQRRGKGKNLSPFMSDEELLREIPELLKGIGESSHRIKRIVKKLKDFSSQGSTDYFQEVIINDVADSAVIISSSLIRNSTDHFTIDYGHNLPVIKGNSQELEQVIINLITNACHALPSKDRGIRLATTYSKKDHAVEVRVTDEGCGIPDHIISNIMEPFFTTKRDSGGTGLGLSVSFTIMQNHRGELKFKSEAGKGTEAIMRLFTDSRHMIERRKNNG